MAGDGALFERKQTGLLLLRGPFLVKNSKDRYWITAHINLTCENNKPYWLNVMLIHVLLTYQAACRRSPNTPWITARRRTAIILYAKCCFCTEIQVSRLTFHCYEW